MSSHKTRDKSADSSSSPAPPSYAESELTEVSLGTLADLPDALSAAKARLTDFHCKKHIVQDLSPSEQLNLMILMLAARVHDLEEQQSAARIQQLEARLAAADTQNYILWYAVKQLQGVSPQFQALPQLVYDNGLWKMR